MAVTKAVSRKTRMVSAATLIAGFFLSSCATVFSDKITAYQKTKPTPPARREIRPGFLIADIFLGGVVAVAIDFATGAIYKPAPPSQPGQVVSK